MKMKKSDEVGRLKRLLYNDYFNIPKSAFGVLKTDITNLLKSYFDIEERTVNLSVEPDSEGNFRLTLTAEATQIKELRILD